MRGGHAVKPRPHLRECMSKFLNLRNFGHFNILTMTVREFDKAPEGTAVRGIAIETERVSFVVAIDEVGITDEVGPAEGAAPWRIPTTEEVAIMGEARVEFNAIAARMGASPLKLARYWAIGKEGRPARVYTRTGKAEQLTNGNARLRLVSNIETTENRA